MPHTVHSRYKLIKGWIDVEVSFLYQIRYCIVYEKQNPVALTSGCMIFQQGGSHRETEARLREEIKQLSKEASLMSQ